MSQSLRPINRSGRSRSNELRTDFLEQSANKGLDAPLSSITEVPMRLLLNYTMARDVCVSRTPAAATAVPPRRHSVKYTKRGKTFPVSLYFSKNAQSWVEREPTSLNRGGCKKGFTGKLHTETRVR